MSSESQANENLHRVALQLTQRRALQRERLAERRRGLETRGRARLAAFTKALGKENAALWRDMLRNGAEASEAASARITGIRQQLIASAAAPLVTVGFERTMADGGNDPAPPILTPDLVVYQSYPYQYNPSEEMNPTSIRVHAKAAGDGSGICGTGEDSGNAAVDWLWHFRPVKTGYNDFQISIPLNGFYVVYADDGWSDSKEASISIDLWVEAEQYNWKAGTQTNLISIDSQNIDVNDRFDQVHNSYYSALLAEGDEAILHVQLFFDVKARGGGSHAELNFEDGTANRLDAPWITIT